jgi:hypothetical protein
MRVYMSCKVFTSFSKGMCNCMSWVFLVLNVRSFDCFTGCMTWVLVLNVLGVLVLCVHRLGRFTGSMTQVFGTQCSCV